MFREKLSDLFTILLFSCLSYLVTSALPVRSLQARRPCTSFKLKGTTVAVARREGIPVIISTVLHLPVSDHNYGKTQCICERLKMSAFRDNKH